MKKIIPITSLVLWAISLLLLIGLPLFDGGITSVMLLTIFTSAAALTTVPALLIVTAGSFVSDATRENNTFITVTKILAFIILALLITSTSCAIRSLWFNPLSLEGYGNRFVYENISTGTGFAAIVATYILSRLQQDIYWVTRKRSSKLDERQLTERRIVFETSYKLGFLAVALAAYLVAPTLYNLPTIIAYNHGTLPGHVHWLMVNLIVLLAALPLIIASWRKHKS